MIAVLLLGLAVQGDAAPAAQPTPKPERKICRPVEHTGSRMAKSRECHTAAEWNKLQDGNYGHDLDRIGTMNKPFP